MTIPAEGIAHYFAHDRHWQKAHILCMGASGGFDLIHYILESFRDPRAKNNKSTNKKTKKMIPNLQK
jgi:hypothetical protein